MRVACGHVGELAVREGEIGAAVLGAQLHGDETPAIVSEVARTVPVIKAFRIAADERGGAQCAKDADRERQTIEEGGKEKEVAWGPIGPWVDSSIG